MLNQQMTGRAEEVLDLCRTQGLRVAIVESCTGGLVCAALTDVPGSSDVVDCGYVTYSDEAKHAMVRVPRELIQFRGAVSEEVARAMADCGLKTSGADIVVALTGIAGPGGGSAEKPVGLVHIAGIRRRGGIMHQRHVFPGDRAAVREAAVMAALDMMIRLAS